MIDSIQDLSEYSVHIEEHFVRTIKIRARDLEEAMSLAGEIYDSQKAPEPVLSAKLMQIDNEQTHECTEWIEF